MASKFVTTGDGRFMCRAEDYRSHRTILNNGLIGNCLDIDYVVEGKRLNPTIPYPTAQECLAASRFLENSVLDALAKNKAEGQEEER